MLDKLTEGGLEHQGRKLGLTSLLKQLGCRDPGIFERSLHVWALGGAKLSRDEAIRVARERGVKIITFKEVLDDIIHDARQRIEREEWFEPKTLHRQ